MLIKIKKNGVLIFKKFRFRCVLGKLGIKKNKKEGDKTTPRGIFSLGKLYYRSDRIKKIETHLKCKVIKKYTGWCNDPNDRKYNKEFDLNSKKKGEKLFRKDHKYDALIPINYNVNQFVNHCKNSLCLNVIGLMCLPPISDNPEKYFLHLNKLRNQTDLCHLSMGMSNDYQTAIKCGSTFLRIGSKILGERNTN